MAGRSQIVGMNVVKFSEEADIVLPPLSFELEEGSPYK